MSTVTAIYENGVFRPTERVDLPERCSVELDVRMRDGNGQPPAASAASEPAEPRRDKLSIEEKIAAIAAEIPPEEWDRLPRDLSEHLDHYLYGLPRE